MIRNTKEVPLFTKKKISNETTLAIWKCSESLETLSSLVNIDDSDHAKLASFSNEKRKIHFLSTRILCGLIAPEAKIRYNAEGKPYLNSVNLHLSITHSHDFVAVLFSSSPFIGLDIQKKQDNIFRIKDRFVNEIEKNSFNYDDLDDLTLIWCAKESIYKIHGDRNVFFKEHMEVRRVDNDSTRFDVKLNHHLYEGVHRIQVELIEDYTLVYTVFD